jgi:hypothetical protein
VAELWQITRVPSFPWFQIPSSEVPLPSLSLFSSKMRSSIIPDYPACLTYDAEYPSDLSSALPSDSEVYELIDLHYSPNPSAVQLVIFYPLKDITRHAYRKTPVKYLIPAKYWRIIASRFLPRYCQYQKYSHWENEKQRRNKGLSEGEKKRDDTCFDMGPKETMKWTYYKRLWDSFLIEAAFWNQNVGTEENWNSLESVRLHCWIHREYYGCTHDASGRELYLELSKRNDRSAYKTDLTTVGRYF